jgi:hypothetical protein
VLFNNNKNKIKSFALYLKVGLFLTFMVKTLEKWQIYGTIFIWKNGLK